MTGESIVYLLAFAVLGGGIFLWRVLRQTLGDGPEKRLRRAPLVRIGDVERGTQVKIAGKVRLVDEPLLGPMTGEPCAAFELWIEYRDPYSPGSRQILSKLWHDADVQCEAGRFLIEDDTGTLLVEADSDTIIMVGADDGFLSVGEDRSHVLELLSAKVDTSLVANHEFRYREWRLADGMEVAVLGKVIDRVDPPEGSGDHHGARQIPLIGGTFEEPVHVTDSEGLFGRPRPDR